MKKHPHKQKQTPKPPQTHIEPTLGDLLRELWLGRRYILIGLLFGILCATLLSALATPHYKAQMIIAPARPLQAEQTAAVTKESDARSEAQNLFTRFEATYKGPSVAAILLRDPDILDGLQKDSWFLKSSDAKTPQTAAELSDYINERVQNTPIGETPLRTLSYLHPDPAFAGLFLRRLHDVTDGLIRHAVRYNVNERIAYLQEALGKMPNPDNKRALTDLLLEQERLKMLVSIDQPYAAALIEPPAASARPLWPDYTLVFITFTLSAAMLGFALFWIRNTMALTMQTPNITERRLQKRKKRPARKIRDWVKLDSGNNNDKKPFSASNAAE
ncbi:MAG: hypothetical protein KDI46_09430 [Alphaproteobacteria bacterium]|nr:hypothetical protein [Alphaproteobacteria bacterium]